MANKDSGASAPPGDDDERLSAAFAALADPTRRRILGLLRESPHMRVTDIADVFDMSLNGVSKHLKVLEAAGLISRETTGRVHHMSARWEGLQPPYEWLHFHHHFWSKRLDGLVDYIKKRTKK